MSVYVKDQDFTSKGRVFSVSREAQPGFIEMGSYTESSEYPYLRLPARVKLQKWANSTPGYVAQAVYSVRRP